MLVIHWAMQNKTSVILANGIRPSARKCPNGAACNSKGVYVYPFSRNKTLRGNWRRNLKVWDNGIGNRNGFVFRLEPQDFPLLAGHWVFLQLDPEGGKLKSLQELAERCGDYFSGAVADKVDSFGDGYNWSDFEIIIPRLVEPRRIIKVIKDREPRRK